MQIDVAEHLGSTSYFYANTGSAEELIIERDDGHRSGNPETLTVSIAAARSYLFDVAGQRLR